MIALIPLALAIALFYGPKISPILGMGPSSILSTAVAAGGFGPVPGYPVHNLISRIFLQLPFDRPAYALNVASFTMAVLAILAFTRLLALLLENHLGRKLHPLEVFTVGLGFSFLYFQSPALARISFFGDRYTTELFFVSLAGNFFAEALLKPERLRRGLLASAFLMTFIFFCHPKSMALIWFLASILFLQTYRLKQRPPWLAMTGLSVLGFAIPVAILMLTSRRDPLFDWGNPDTLQNVWYAITRKEYAFIDLSRSFDDGIMGWKRQYRTLFQQFNWPVFLAAVAGLVTVSLRSWRAGTLFIAALLLTGEWVSIVQHLKNPANEPNLSRMFDWILLNYFDPYYSLFALLAIFAVAAYWLSLPGFRRTYATFIFLAGFISWNAVGSGKNSYREYGMSDELARNFDIALPEGAVLFTNVDSLFSSLVHNQLHGGLLRGRYILNTELMFRSWYYNDIERMYPVFWSKHADLLSKIRGQLLAFERAGYRRDDFDFKLYLKTLNALAEDHMEAGAYLYYDPVIQQIRPGSFTNMRWEPEALMLRLVKGNFRISTLNLEGLKFDSLKRQRERGDIWPERFFAIFADITETRLKRARLLESEEAARLEKLLMEMR